MPSTRPPLTTLCTALAALIPFSLPGHASSSPDDASAKPYTVFVGLELTLERERKDWPVVGSDGNSVEILQDGSEVRMPLEAGDFKTKFAPRLSRSEIEIGQLKTKRIDTQGEEQVRDAFRQMVLMESVEAQRKEVSELYTRHSYDVFGLESAKAARGSDNAKELETARAAVERNGGNYVQAHVAPQFSSYLPGADLMTSEDLGAGGRFDAFEVTFKVSSPTEINDAYGVLRIVVRDPANSRQPIACIKFFKVRHLGPKPQNFTIMQENLPLGFSVEGFAVHILADGREIPNSLSKNRLDLSEDEAHQFLVINYLQENAKGSLPVAVVPELLSPALKALIGENQVNARVDLAINADGRVTAIRQAHGLSSPLSAELAAALHAIRFFPALVDGKPIDGLGTFGLSELVR